MDQRSKAALFSKLHSGPDILVLPNAWDAISARIVEREGFPAGATGSAGVAAVLGYPDGQRIPRREMLYMVGRICAAVNVPITADVEAGYDDPVQTARDVIAAGGVGMNFEDMVDHVLLPLDEQIAKIRAIKAAVQSLPGFVLNARSDIFLARHGEEGGRFDRIVERLNAYREAGADCLFAPGIADADTIGRLTKAVKGPLNILATVGTPPVSELQRLGVRRVSLGSGPSRVSLGALQRLARKLRDEGSFEPLATEAIPYAEVQKILSRQE
jgi:2-methylisocitrate lyase-like PEP mutase family enzyme